jgi:membrane fusion protein (multidrug efflux system)
VRGTGTAVAADIADHAAPMGATVAEALVSPGDAVAVGQPLVRYRSDAIRLGYAQADAAATAAEAQAANAEAELARIVPLGDRGSVAESQVDARRLQAGASRAQADAARSAARAAAASLSDLVVRAEFDGTVVAVAAQVGELASPASAPVRIADLSALEVRLRVHERDLPRIRRGNTVVAGFPNLGRHLEGTVSWVSMELDPATRTTEVRVSLPNPAADIPSGALVEAEISAESPREGVVVPRAAVGGTGGERFVWLVEGDSAVRQPVEVRPVDHDHVEIAAGLTDGQNIVRNRLGAVAAGPVRVAGGVR